MKYTQVRSFHAVAKAGSFTGAAKDLNVSQPTITEQVKELEATYGIEVFNRAQRKVALAGSSSGSSTTSQCVGSAAVSMYRSYWSRIADAPATMIICYAQWFT